MSLRNVNNGPKIMQYIQQHPRCDLTTSYLAKRFVHIFWISFVFTCKKAKRNWHQFKYIYFWSYEQNNTFESNKVLRMKMFKFDIPWSWQWNIETWIKHHYHLANGFLPTWKRLFKKRYQDYTFFSNYRMSNERKLRKPDESFS